MTIVGAPSPALDKPGRRWADFVGCACYAASALYLVARSSWGFTVLLLPLFMHDTAIAVSFLKREPPTRAMNGWGPRLIAYVNAFGLLGFMTFAKIAHPEWLRITENRELLPAVTVVWLGAAFLSVWNIWSLRQSFSIEPQARRLVAKGPYAFARHPIYLSYLFQHGALAIAMPTRQMIAAFTAWFGTVLVRIQLEERVLSEAFPEYAQYRRRVGVFWPKARPWRADKSEPAN